MAESAEPAPDKKSMAESAEPAPDKKSKYII